MTFAAYWTSVATTLALDIQCPFEVSSRDGTLIRAPVLLRNFGGRNGMVLFDGLPSDWREIGDALVDMGYGVSCLGPYSQDEMVDLETAKEVLADWTWSGPPDERPPWLTAQPRNELDAT